MKYLFSYAKDVSKPPQHSVGARHRRNNTGTTRKAKGVAVVLTRPRPTDDPYDNTIGGPNDYAYRM